MKKGREKVFKIIKILVFALFVEIILSNITYFNLMLCAKKNYVAKYDVSSKRLSIDTNDYQVQNIKIYYKNDNVVNQVISYSPKIIMYGDQYETRDLSPKYMVGNKNVKINLNSVNKTVALVIDIDNELAMQKIDKVVINDTSIEFSFFRFLFIVIIMLIIKVLKQTKNIMYDDKDKKNVLCFYSIIMIFLVLVVLFFKFSGVNFGSFEKKISKYGNNFLNAQIEAILDKKVDLNVKADDFLFELPHPLDHSERMLSGIDQSETSDYSIYNGKIYSYFGVAPLLLMLPFKFITGYYMSNYIANLIFFIVMVFAMAKLYRMIVNRYVKKVTFNNFLLGFFTVFVASTSLILLRGEVYDIVTCCALLYTILSYICILSIYNNPKKHVLLKIFFCSLFMGLIVLSKPSFIVYYIFLFYELFNLRKVLKNNVFKNSVKLFVIPISVCGIFQMWWNYLRFDSVFVFGIEYQMSLLKMSNLLYVSPMKLFIGLLKSCFVLPEVDYNSFPFLYLRDLGWISYDMNVFSYVPGVIGICTVPIFWVYFIYKYVKEKYKFEDNFNKNLKCLFITLFLLLLLNIRNGVCEQYIVDIKLFLYMFAVIISFKVLEKDSKFNKVFNWVCLISIIMVLPIGLNMDAFGLFSNKAKLLIHLKNIFEFWM